MGSDKDGNDITLIDVLSVPADSIVEEVENKVLMEKVRECVRALPERERTIVSLRYGLYDGVPYTQLQVAGKLGISRSYVSRIEKKALAKISAKLGK